MINLFRPFVPPETIAAVSEVLHSRWIGQGPKVDLFEKKFSEMFGVPHIASMNSGTSALDTAYDLIGLKQGDEVITTPLTCTATNLPLLRRGCKLVWADIDPKTLCVDPADVYRKTTPQTKAIVQVHLGGIEAQCHSRLPCNSRVPIVSDACQALGVFVGDYTCCSFQAIKHITTGDGGMLVLNTPNSERDRNNAQLLRWFGIDRNKKVKNNWQAYKERRLTFDIKLPGTKRQTTDIAAVMGLVGLDHYDEMMEVRRNQFCLYNSCLSGIDGITLVDGEHNTFWLATVLVERRDDFARVMFEAGIDTNMVQVRNDLYKVFGGERQELPGLNSIEDKYLSIPIGPHVTEEEVQYICNVIKAGW